MRRRTTWGLIGAWTLLAGCTPEATPEASGAATGGDATGTGEAPTSGGDAATETADGETTGGAEQGTADTGASASEDDGGSLDTGDTSDDSGDAGSETGEPPPLSEARVVGYFPAWGVYDRDFHVAEIAADKLTHVNYGFANLTAEGNCALGDPYADTEKFYDGDSMEPGALRGSFHQLQLLRQAHPHLRTMISVGGWTWSGHFSPAAASPESRAELAASCVAFMRQYDFDGIDIDWEFPGGGGLEGNAVSADDGKNYALLLAELRAQLDAAEGEDGRAYELTIAAPAGPATIANLGAAELHPHLSFINVMAYDFFGAWAPETAFNAPLYAVDGDAPGMNVAAAIDAYLAAGVPADKLVLGTPFYGRSFAGVQGGQDGLHAPHTGAGPGTWEPGVLDFWDIQQNYAQKYPRFWDEAGQVPWLYDQASGLMISYDDEQSLTRKAAFIRERQLGGAMVWDLSGDLPGATLLGVLHGELTR